VAEDRAPKKRKVAAKAVANKKSAPGNQDREIECLLCERIALHKAKKKYCMTCNPDVEAMRRDSLKEMGKEFMIDLEAAENLVKLRVVWNKWKLIVGPGGGNRCGIFSWALFKKL